MLPNGKKVSSIFVIVIVWCYAKLHDKCAQIRESEGSVLEKYYHKEVKHYDA